MPKYKIKSMIAKVKSEYHYDEDYNIMPKMPNAQPIGEPDAQIKCQYSEEAKRYAVASQDLENSRFYASYIDADGTLTLKFSMVGTATFDDIPGTEDIPKDRRLTSEELEVIHKAAVERISKKLDGLK